ncbi:MAG TPA: malonyl-CoA decarboxylase, partial [Rhodospirillaceae bacterium]|nr:malonyl-CoA decarboxylase [Rhodospirillaceae bacterium]
LKAEWHQDAAAAEGLKPILQRLCARYLSELREGGGRAIDPVAHFHLTNGARMERLNWLADRSSKGLSQSAGMMINYLYKLSEIETNHEAYSGQGRIAMSAAIKSLLKE